MGRMQEIAIALDDLSQGVTLARLESLQESLTPLHFDTQNHRDNTWWIEQDAQMERDDLDALEYQAEIEDIRLNGYA